MTIKAILLLALLLSGCATQVLDPKTGHVVFKTYADAKNISYINGSFHADSLDHSTPTRAAGSIVGTTGAAISASGLTAILK